VHSTPPTNTPIDTTRRRFLTVAAGANVASVGALTVAAMPADAPDRGACAVDTAFALIDAKRAADVAHCDAIDQVDEAEVNTAMPRKPHGTPTSAAKPLVTP
jgi:hypothetical protein